MIVTEKEFKKGILILKKRNKCFSSLVKQIGSITFKKRILDFEALIGIIIKQQLSNSASKSIIEKLKTLFPNSKRITPNDIKKIKTNDLRHTGISFSKIEFIKNLSKKIIENPNLFENWGKLNTEEAFKEIQKIKGFGPWSTSIILLFHLGRIDIFPRGDTTLEKAYLKIYGSSLDKNLKKLNWCIPYRGVLAIYLWKWVDQGMIDLE